MSFKIFKPFCLLSCTLLLFTANSFPTLNLVTNQTFMGTHVNAANDIVYGDVNGDDTVDSGDYTLMRKHLLGISTLPAPNWKQSGDLNIDGVVDSADYTCLRKYILGIITSLPLTDNPTASPTPTTITKVDAFPDWDKVHTGYATFTGSGYSGGTCLLDPIDRDMEIAALNWGDYYDNYGVESALAGAYLEVSGAKGKTVIYVCDLYPEGGPGALDLCPTSFGKLDDMEKGKIDISWRIIKAPITGNVSYRIKEGSTRDWLAIQVRNHLYPVLKMEYLKDGQWVNMKKMFWNHFIAEQLTTTTPTIRMTDIRGNVITDVVNKIPDVNEPGKEAYIVPGNVQFPE